MELWILYSVLMLAAPTGVFWWTDTHYEQQCEARNAALVADQREGPLQDCKGLF